MRRLPSLLLGGGALVFLAACSSSGATDYTQYWELLKQSASATFGKSSIALDQAASIPYASMGWRFNDSPQGIIVLASDTAGEQMWTSAARIVLVTQNSRVKRTVGLPRNLGGLAWGKNSGLTAPVEAALLGRTEQYTVDFPDLGVYAVAVRCRAVNKGLRSITILGQKIVTNRIEENCTSAALRWTFSNIYWAAPNTGFVWRSRQAIHPQGDTLEIEIFRPPE